MSKLTKKQEKTFKGTFKEDGTLRVVVAKVRHDDRCGNGRNTFTITGNVYGPNGDARDGVCRLDNGRKLKNECSGCVHEEIAKAIPELKPLLKWHLTSTDSPMHYIGNTVYLAGDRDCYGLRKGEERQIRKSSTGLPCWKWEADTCPETRGELRYVPWMRVGEGKERDLDAARRAAVWPEATDEELMQDPKDLKKALKDRLPALMERFKSDVESLGLTY